MKPTEQTKFYDPIAKTKGNYLSACLASLVEIPIDSVPKFEDMNSQSEIDITMDIWLKSIGYNRVVCKHAFPSNYRLSKCIIIGKTKFGLEHAMISKDGLIIHNPHPDKIEIETIEEYWFILKSKN